MLLICNKVENYVRFKKNHMKTGFELLNLHDIDCQQLRNTIQFNSHSLT